MAVDKTIVPKLPNLDEYVVPLAKMVARTAYLPAPETVAALNGAVFPTTRDSQARITPIEREGAVIGMYDDNTTPRWALLWAHGISGVGKMPSAGWTFAHVWSASDDIDSYTNLANLAMIPECFASLTDKNGPLTRFLQWHAWEKYHWKPNARGQPTRPNGYELITWNYFPHIADPVAFIRVQLGKATCKRSQILKPLMLPDKS